MSSVNINRSLTDQFYRYKMPKLIAKVEGKGNGIKTVIVNMADVAKALNRPPTYPTKYFGCEVGAQTQCDIKNDRFIVNGSHDVFKLQELLDGFIKRYVLCLSCDNPETVLSVNNKKGLINSKCKACGHSGQVDSKHKLATFIIKNPPDQESSQASSTMQSGKKNRGKGKDEKTCGKSNGEETHLDEFHLAENLKGTSDQFGDDDWAVDTNPQAVASRLAGIAPEIKGLVLDDDMGKSYMDRLDIFYGFVTKLIVEKENSLKPCLNASHFHAIYAETERLEVKEKASLILCELLLDETILGQINHYRPLFLKLTVDCHKAQRYLIGGLEQIIKLHESVLMSKVSKIFHNFYNADILDEEVILEWASKISKKFVSKEIAQEIHEKATPFIKWLKEAEEEESSEDEDAIEVVYSDHVRTSSLLEVKETLKETPKDADSEDDELDIDAI